MKQKNFPNISTSDGRLILTNYWYDLSVVQRLSAIIFLPRLWLTACFRKELTIISEDTSYSFNHSLGMKLGTRVLMEEIIGKHYFNAIQASVYFGAVIMLVFLAMRFAGVISEEISLIGIAIEAIMLVSLAAVIYYTKEEVDNNSNLSIEAISGENDYTKDLLSEIEQIGGQYASLTISLEKSVNSQTENVKELTNKVSQISGLQSLNDHTDQLKTTNQLLMQLVLAIDEMNKRIDLLTGKELEFHVRTELQKIISKKIKT